MGGNFIQWLKENNEAKFHMDVAVPAFIFARVPSTWHMKHTNAESILGHYILCSDEK